ncbi:MAG: acylphosphatase [Rhodospirillales bacterium]
MGVRTVHVRVTGRVQGVWFRGWTVKEADRLGITGWVRNRRDGSVEAVFSGNEDDVETMLKLCRKGPPLARVDALTSREIDAGPFSGFEKCPTE